MNIYQLMETKNFYSFPQLWLMVPNNQMLKQTLLQEFKLFLVVVVLELD
jgi:hypothetical protein